VQAGATSTRLPFFMVLVLQIIMNTYSLSMSVTKLVLFHEHHVIILFFFWSMGLLHATLFLNFLDYLINLYTHGPTISRKHSMSNIALIVQTFSFLIIFCLCFILMI
jgi:hypothetical protein